MTETGTQQPAATRAHWLERSRFHLVLIAVAFNLAVFALTRLGLLIQSWNDVAPGFLDVVGIFTVGVIYDLALSSYFFIPFVIYLIFVPQKIFRWKIHRWLIYALFLLYAYGLFFTQVAEWLFWEEFGVRFNFISVDYLIYRREVTDNIAQSYPVAILLEGIFVATLAAGLLIRTAVKRAARADEPFRRRLAVGASLLALPVTAFFLVGQSLHEISSNRFENELAVNGIYQFFHAFAANELDYRTFYATRPEAEVASRLRRLVEEPEVDFVGDQPLDLRRRIRGREDGGRKLNVILVSVESLSAKYLGVFGNQQGITPYLDALAEDSLFFTNFFATGTRTARGLESITLSVPPTPGRSLLKRQDNAGLFCLGSVFQDLGYDTKFLYGGRGYFDNMNTFFSRNGYTVLDISDVPREEISFENAWGMADEDLFRRTMLEADRDFEQGTPFFFQVMTTSNHRPYTYPDGRIDIPSGTGRPGAVKYADYALHYLLEQARSRPWFDTTVFVIVADHCAGSAGRSALPLFRYHIPMFVYAPALIEPRQIDTLSSQIDIAPTLLGLLGLPYESRFFGKDILRMSPNDGRALIGNYQRLGLYRNGKMAYLSPKQQINVVDDPLGEARDSREILPADRQLVEDTIAFYQGASDIFDRRLYDR
ncbi:MAG TPA: alkaline phosphatase family protein [Acidobacteria bacterium]|nr:alkaline phosphatase family protein [Acidobacteriota bacterium]